MPLAVLELVGAVDRQASAGFFFAEPLGKRRLIHAKECARRHRRLSGVRNDASFFQPACRSFHSR